MPRELPNWLYRAVLFGCLALLGMIGQEIRNDVRSLAEKTIVVQQSVTALQRDADRMWVKLYGEKRAENNGK